MNFHIPSLVPIQSLFAWGPPPPEGMANDRCVILIEPIDITRRQFKLDPS